MEIGLTTEITFGKYKGSTIHQLFDNIHRRSVQIRVGYLAWVTRVTQHTLTAEAEAYVQDVVRYYDIGGLASNQDRRPSTDLSYDDKIEGNNPHTWVCR